MESRALSPMQVGGTDGLVPEGAGAAAATPVLSPLRLTLLKRVGAELIGTFMLIFTTVAANIMNEKTNGSITHMGLGISSGLAVAVVIFSIGHISGAHVNPAITFAFATIKHFPWIEVPLYLVAQFGGSLCASYTVMVVFQPSFYDPHHSHVISGVTVPIGSNLQALIIEFIISCTLMFVVTSISIDKHAARELAGVVVGAMVTLNNLIASPISGASMNPARTLGPAIVARNYNGLWLYLVGPHLGAMVGAACYSMIQLKNQDDKFHKTKRVDFGDTLEA